MRITREFGAYNERRYSRPWIARVTSWPVGERPSLVFGRFLGRHGDSGECEIEAESGDIIRWGQKDTRNARGTEAKWGVITPDGSVVQLTESNARKSFKGVQ